MYQCMHPKLKHIVDFETSEIVCSLCGEVIGVSMLVINETRKIRLDTLFVRIFQGEMRNEQRRETSRENEIRAYRVYL